MSHPSDVLIFSIRTKPPLTKLVIRIDSSHVWEYVRTLAFCFEGYGDAVRPHIFGAAKISWKRRPPHSYLPPLALLGVLSGAFWNSDTKLQYHYHRSGKTCWRCAENKSKLTGKGLESPIVQVHADPTPPKHPKHHF